MEVLLLILSLIPMARAGFTMYSGKCTIDGEDQNLWEMHQQGEFTHWECEQICLDSTDGCIGYEWNKVTNHCSYHTRRIDARGGGDADSDVDCYYREHEEWCEKTNQQYPHGGETCKVIQNVPNIDECRTMCIEETDDCNAVVHDRKKKTCWHFCGVPAVKTMPAPYKSTRTMWGRLCGDGGCSSDPDCEEGEFCEFTDKVGRCKPLPPTEEPTEGTGEPTEAATTELPTEATQEPTDATRLPTEATQEPTDATREPTDATQEPTDATTEPTSVTLEPTDATSEPTDATSEPTDATLEPTEATQEPTEPLTTVEPTTHAPTPTPPCGDMGLGLDGKWDDKWLEVTPSVGVYTKNYFIFEDGCFCMFNDWISGLTECCPDNYNYFSFYLKGAGGTEHWEMWLYCDSTVKVDVDGVTTVERGEFSDDVVGGAGFGPTPNDPTDHTTYELCIVSDKGAEFEMTLADPTSSSKKETCNKDPVTDEPREIFVVIDEDGTMSTTEECEDSNGCNPQWPGACQSDADCDGGQESCVANTCAVWHYCGYTGGKDCEGTDLEDLGHVTLESCFNAFLGKPDCAYFKHASAGTCKLFAGSCAGPIKLQTSSTYILTYMMQRCENVIKSPEDGKCYYHDDWFCQDGLFCNAVGKCAVPGTCAGDADCEEQQHCDNEVCEWNCPRDNSQCLQDAWGGSFECEKDSSYCTSYTKLYPRCCPVACGLDHPMTEAECDEAPLGYTECPEYPNEYFCTMECAGDEGCPEYYGCTGGLCVAQKRKEGEPCDDEKSYKLCDDGLYCNSATECAKPGSCAADVDCGENQKCHEGNCMDKTDVGGPCYNDDDDYCVEGLFCNAASKCGAPGSCAGDADCEEQQRCDNEVCEWDCPRDNAQCLRDEWGGSYECEKDSELCDSYPRFYPRCCPVACGWDHPMTKAECEAQPTGWTPCPEYPNEYFCTMETEEEASFLAVVELPTTKEKLVSYHAVVEKGTRGIAASYGVYLLALVGIVAVVYRGIPLIRGGQRKETYNQIRTDGLKTYNTV